MVRLIKKFAADHPVVAFSKLKNRSCISTLNRIELDYIEYSQKLYDYISNGIFHTRKLNRDINCDYIQSVKNGNTRHYFRPAEKFKELLEKRYDVK